MNTGKSHGKGTDFIDALPYDGERRLMLAVLIDGLRSICLRHRPEHLTDYREWLRDRDWMMSDDRTRPFSFASICDVLGIDAGYLRRSVLKTRDGGQSLNLHRYAARVEDSWEAQRRGSSNGSNGSTHRPEGAYSGNGRKAARARRKRGETSATTHSASGLTDKTAQALA
jgi:hypothetical protein